MKRGKQIKQLGLFWDSDHEVNVTVSNIITGLIVALQVRWDRDKVCLDMVCFDKVC